jgi:branched-chain amino acid transport system substrate-binding protein
MHDRRHRGRLPALIALAAIAASVIAVGAGTAGAATASAKKPKGTELLIGQVSSQTSPTLATPNTEAADTISAWVKWTNANGGINDHVVRAIVKDDKTDPAVAKQVVQELVETDKVLAIVGETASANDSAWQQYTRDQKVPVIGGNPYSTFWFTNPMWYPASTTVVSGLYGQIDAVAKLSSAKTIGFIACAETPQCIQALPVFKGFAEPLGLKFVYEKVAPAQAPSYTAECLGAKQAGAQALFPAGLNNATFIRDCERQDYRPVYITSQGTLNEQTAAENPSMTAVGNVWNFPWFKQFPETKDYFAAMKKYYPEYLKKDYTKDATNAGPIVWTSLEAFKKAIENANVAPTATATRADVIRGLSMFKGETLGGIMAPLTYSDGNAPNPQQKCYYLVSVKKGKYQAPNGLEYACQP